MAAQERVPVLIVGAGGAGFSLFPLLRQQGIASVLGERRPDVSWVPRARNLNFRTLEVFRGLELEPQVISAGSRPSAGVNDDGRRFPRRASHSRRDPRPCPSE